MLIRPDGKEREDLWKCDSVKQATDKNNKLVYQEAEIKETGTNIPWNWKAHDKDAGCRISPEEASLIWANANPNTNGNTSNPDFPDSFQYQLWYWKGGQDDRLFYRISKTDLIVYTTEFCFQPTGYFDIACFARVIAEDGQVVGKEQGRMSAKIFDMARITSQDDFKRNGCTMTNTATYPECKHPEGETDANKCATDDGCIVLEPKTNQNDIVPNIGNGNAPPWAKPVPDWDTYDGKQKEDPERLKHQYRDGVFGDKNNIALSLAPQWARPVSESDKEKTNMICFWYKPNWDVNDPCAVPHSILDANGDLVSENGIARYNDKDKEDRTKLFQLYNEHKAISPQIEDPDRPRWSMFVWDHKKTQDNEQNKDTDQGRSVHFTFSMPDGLSQNRWIYYCLRWNGQKLGIDINDKKAELMQRKTHIGFVVFGLLNDDHSGMESKFFHFIAEDWSLNTPILESIQTKNIQYLYGSQGPCLRGYEFCSPDKGFGNYGSSVGRDFYGERWATIEQNKQHIGSLFNTGMLHLVLGRFVIYHGGIQIKTTPLLGGIISEEEFKKSNHPLTLLRSKWIEQCLSLTPEEKTKWIELIEREIDKVQKTPDEKLKEYEIRLLPEEFENSGGPRRYFGEIWNDTLTWDGTFSGHTSADMLNHILFAVRKPPVQDSSSQNLLKQYPGQWADAYRTVLVQLINKYGCIAYHYRMHSIYLKPSVDLASDMDISPKSDRLHLGGPLKYLHPESALNPAVYSMNSPSHGSYANVMVFNNLKNMDEAENLSASIFEQGRYKNEPAVFSSNWDIRTKASSGVVHLGAIRWTEYLPQDCLVNKIPQEAKMRITIQLHGKDGAIQPQKRDDSCIGQSPADSTALNAVIEDESGSSTIRLQYNVSFDRDVNDENIENEKKRIKRIIATPMLDDITITYSTGWQCLEWEQVWK